MSRLALSCLFVLLSFSPVRAEPRVEKIGFYFIDTGTAPGPAVLSISLQTDQMFSCMGYTLPTSVHVHGSVIDIRIGKVTPLKDVCLTAFGPAQGSAKIGTLSAGTYRLQLTHGSVVDQYVLTVTPDGTELKPQQGRFSTSFVQAVYRVAEGAAHLSCIFGLDARCAERAKKGSPTCDSLFADPAVVALTPLESRPGPYSQSFFNEDGKRFAPPAFEKLRPVVMDKRFSDPERCLVITVHSGRGESFSNLNP